GFADFPAVLARPAPRLNSQRSPSAHSARTVAAKHEDEARRLRLRAGRPALRSSAPRRRCASRTQPPSWGTPVARVRRSVRLEGSGNFAKPLAASEPRHLVCACRFASSVTVAPDRTAPRCADARLDGRAGASRGRVFAVSVRRYGLDCVRCCGHWPLSSFITAEISKTDLLAFMHSAGPWRSQRLQALSSTQPVLHPTRRRRRRGRAYDAPPRRGGWPAARAICGAARSAGRGAGVRAAGTHAI